MKIKKLFFVGLLLFNSFTSNSFAIDEKTQDIKYIRKPSFYDKMLNTKKGGSLHFPLGNDPKVMNPILSSDTESSSIEQFLWMSPFFLDPETLDYIPALAKSYIISADKKNYTFVLYEKAKWQDGSPVTAEDYKFTFDTMMNPKIHSAALRSYYDGITLKIDNKYQITFTVLEPKFDTFDFLSRYVPIQKKQFESSKDFNKDKGIMNPISNGPYIMDKYKRGQNITFIRNKNWWGYELSQFKNRFNVDEIILDIIPEPNLSYEKFVKGDIDHMSFTAEQWNTKVIGIDKDKYGSSPKEKNIWALKTQNKSAKPYTYIGWNFKNPLFQDVKTRKALSYLVDYKKIIEKVYFNLFTQCVSPFGTFTLNTAPELRQKNNIISYDRAKAVKLLKESGWKNDGSQTLIKEVNGKKIPFEFTLETNTGNPARMKIAEIIKEDFKSAGIKVNIKTAEWNTFLDDVDNRRFDAVILAWTGTIFPNPKQIWHSSSEKNQGSNFISYNNPKIDDLIHRANSEFDPKKRNTIMQEINRIIYEDQPYTFIAEMNYILEGLSSKISSERWVANYETAAANDLFYLVK